MTDTPQGKPSNAPAPTLSETLAQAARLRARLAEALANAPCPDLLSATLRRLQDADGIGQSQMAARLGTDAVGLDRLALCRLPRDEHFAEDVANIADYCGCEASALLSLLRRAQVLVTFAEPAVLSESASGTISMSAERGAGLGWMGSGALIAARDAACDISDAEAGEGDTPHE